MDVMIEWSNSEGFQVNNNNLISIIMGYNVLVSLKQSVSFSGSP